MLDFTSLDMPQDTGISQKNTKRVVMTWFHAYGEIIQMFNQLTLSRDALERQVRLL
jgi:hypothetical protein